MTQQIKHSFDEQTFYSVLATVFSFTMFLFVFKAWSLRKKGRGSAQCMGKNMEQETQSTTTPHETGLVTSRLAQSPALTRPQLSLLMAAGSSFCVFMDSLILLHNIDVDSAGTLVHGSDHEREIYEFTFFGSIFLFISLLLFAQRWCHVVKGIEKQTIVQVTADRSTRIIRYGYGCLAIMHVPFAVMRVIQFPNYDLAVTLFKWCIIVEAVALSLLALLMCYVAFKLQFHSMAEGKTKTSIKQLFIVTILNFVEQLLFDVAMIVIDRLYFSEGYTRSAHVQATYFSLWYGVYWVMHVQILLFFQFVTLSDEGKECLLDEVRESQNDDIENSEAVNTISLTEDEGFENIAAWSQPNGKPARGRMLGSPVAPKAEAMREDKTVNGSCEMNNLEDLRAWSQEIKNSPVRGTMLGSPSLPEAKATVGSAASNPLDLCHTDGSTF